MLWLLSIIVVTQFLVIVFNKIDDSVVNKFANHITNLMESVPAQNETDAKEITGNVTTDIFNKRHYCKIFISHCKTFL